MQAAVSIFSRGPLSLPIRAAQAFGAFSHVASVLQDGTTVEALAFPGKVVERTVPDLLLRSTEAEALVIDVSDDQVRRRDQWLRERVGVRYDYVGAVAAWLSVRNWQQDTQLFCSECDALAWQHAGVLKLSARLRGVMPMTLHYLLVAAGARVVPLHQLVHTLPAVAAVAKA
jgi:hypothetical protein